MRRTGISVVAWRGDDQREMIKRDLIVPLVDLVLAVEGDDSSMSMGMWRSAHPHRSVVR